MTLLSTALCVLLAAAPAAARAPQERDRDAVQARSFAIPETRLAKQLYRLAQEHIDARRWREAIAVLQELSEKHRGELLGASFEIDGRRSQMSVHAGAAETARRTLVALPLEARELYRERYESDARHALDRAAATLDRAELIEVARRWPLTRTAVRAWWTLGDLELELGNARGAAAAWQRAYEHSGASGSGPGPGGEARVQLSRELLEGQGALAEIARDERGGYMSTPGPSDLRGEPPSAECHSWRVRIDVDGRCPFSGERGAADFYNMHPVLAGDTLLVSTSLRLLAIDAFAGTIRWISDEAPGWDAVDSGDVRSLATQGDDQRLSRGDFMRGLDRETLLVAPAAGGGVAVAALQIPVTHISNREFQSIQITTVIPDRRLFAFDLASGRPLWNHMPPPLWDGESGTFSERMRVAGPPIVVGSRVLVPAYRMRGRLDYHVACYDLSSGDLLWSRAIISGQRELNMFGRHEWEFAAPPLAVADDRVIALTGLGSVAAVDLYTGELLWETLYEQIALPEVHQYQPSHRRRHWRNTPPALIGGVVTATPVDSEDLIGLDVETGAMLWSVRYDRLMHGRSRERLTLIGADDTTVFLGGREILARRQPAGLDSRIPPDREDESQVLHQASDVKFDVLPRPTLTASHVVVPTKSRRVVLDRRNLNYEDPRLSTAWREDQMAGNILVAGGAQFTLTGRYLTGFFDWDDLERRFTCARRAPRAP